MLYRSSLRRTSNALEWVRKFTSEVAELVYPHSVSRNGRGLQDERVFEYEFSNDEPPCAHVSTSS